MSPRALDADLWPVFALVWIVCGLRVLAAVHAGEAFGADATIALGAVVGIPFLLRRGQLKG